MASKKYWVTAANGEIVNRNGWTRENAEKQLAWRERDLQFAEAAYKAAEEDDLTFSAGALRKALDELVLSIYWLRDELARE